MKAVENLGFFNSDQYHKRYFVIEFGQPQCHLYEQKNEKTALRSHNQIDIIHAKSLNDAELDEKLRVRGVKRNKGLFKRGTIARCSWNFPFTVTFNEKEYELYAPNKQERDQWVNILGAIAEMNKK